MCCATGGVFEEDLAAIAAWEQAGMEVEGAEGGEEEDEEGLNDALIRAQIMRS